MQKAASVFLSTPAAFISHETFRRAAVKPRLIRMSPEYPARLRRAVRGAGGHCPCLLEVFDQIDVGVTLHARTGRNQLADDDVFLQAQ